MCGLGFHGFSWSTAASDSFGGYLAFDYGRVYPNYLHHRAIGLQLRCLQE
ncbi:MAG: hypothetical protein K2G93_00405 [Rikenella sp.]|nr:hypothetical protein [Rikenella sp.]